MLKNYFTIALRNLWKRRVFSAINILGLTVGMTACFPIFLYLHFELSYDSFHRKADRIYRVVCDIKTPSETIRADCFGKTPMETFKESIILDMQKMIGQHTPAA